MGRDIAIFDLKQNASNLQIACGRGIGGGKVESFFELVQRILYPVAASQSAIVASASNGTWQKAVYAITDCDHENKVDVTGKAHDYDGLMTRVTVTNESDQQKERIHA